MGTSSEGCSHLQGQGQESITRSDANRSGDLTTPSCSNNLANTPMRLMGLRCSLPLQGTRVSEQFFEISGYKQRDACNYTEDKTRYEEEEHGPNWECEDYNKEELNLVTRKELSLPLRMVGRRADDGEGFKAIRFMEP